MSCVTKYLFTYKLVIHLCKKLWLSTNTFYSHQLSANGRPSVLDSSCPLVVLARCGGRQVYLNPPAGLGGREAGRRGGGADYTTRCRLAACSSRSHPSHFQPTAGDRTWLSDLPTGRLAATTTAAHLASPATRQTSDQTADQTSVQIEDQTVDQTADQIDRPDNRPDISFHFISFHLFIYHQRALPQ